MLRELDTLSLGRAVLLTCALLSSSATTARSQEIIPLSNAPAGIVSGQSLEIEVVEVRRLMSWPTTIARPAGKFILLIVNKSPNPAQSFQIDPSTIADGILGSNPLLQLDGSAAVLHRQKLAYVVDLPAGEFHLKSASTAATLCTITGK